MRTGPKQITVFKLGNIYLKFKCIDGGVTAYWGMNGGQYELIKLSDSAVRRLRNWLNWYLDNK